MGMRARGKCSQYLEPGYNYGAAPGSPTTLPVYNPSAHFIFAWGSPVKYRASANLTLVFYSKNPKPVLSRKTTHVSRRFAAVPASPQRSVPRGNGDFGV